MTANPVVPAPPGARCAEHPERDAEVVCARCGGFVCAGCVVSGDLCAPCKRRLLKDGVPWTPQEKARAEARRLGRRAELAMRAELGLCVAGALLGAAVGTGLPGVALASKGAWGLACVVGVICTVLAVRAWRSSEDGRPGPSVSGVFSTGTAVLLGGVGLAPVILSVWTLR